MFSETVAIDSYDFAITANLKEALTHLAWSVQKANHYLWIDAICINQHGSAERSSLVQMMRYILSLIHI